MISCYISKYDQRDSESDVERYVVRYVESNAGRIPYVCYDHARNERIGMVIQMLAIYIYMFDRHTDNAGTLCSDRGRRSYQASDVPAVEGCLSRHGSALEGGV